MGGYAWVTLATNDAYSLGALVLAHSLRRVGTKHELAVLITPGVTQTMREKLSAIFSVVMEVNVLDSKDEANLALLARPELGVTFTKLHCWRLTQYEKCVFLDADTLVVRNCDELFEKEELSAAPDVGWPDCFNSGVFVYKPSQQTFASITAFAAAKGSFDGGDQGLLNMYFSDWARKDISKHLPFIYNMCSTATYSYLPAFKQFGDDVRIIHFIGITKPWLQYFDTLTGIVQPPVGSAHLQPLLQLWWNIFCEKVHPQLSPVMAGLAGVLAQMTLGEPRSAQQIALEEHMRKQSWEQGQIDYMGRDSFDNIWKKICETLALAPPRLPSPPKETQKESTLKTDKTDESVKSIEVIESTDSVDEVDKGIAQATISHTEEQSLVNNVPITNVPTLSGDQKNEDNKFSTKSGIETLDTKLPIQISHEEVAEFSSKSLLKEASEQINLPIKSSNLIQSSSIEEQNVITSPKKLENKLQDVRDLKITVDIEDTKQSNIRDEKHAKQLLTASEILTVSPVPIQVAESVLQVEPKESMSDSQVMPQEILSSTITPVHLTEVEDKLHINGSTSSINFVQNKEKSNLNNSSTVMSIDTANKLGQSEEASQNLSPIQQVQLNDTAGLSSKNLCIPEKSVQEKTVELEQQEQQDKKDESGTNEIIESIKISSEHEVTESLLLDKAPIRPLRTKDLNAPSTSIQINAQSDLIDQEKVIKKPGKKLTEKSVSEVEMETTDGDGVEKKVGRKIVKKVTKKTKIKSEEGPDDSTVDSSSSSKQKKTIKVVKKGVKSSQIGLSDTTVPETPSSSTSDAPIPPKRKTKTAAVKAIKKSGIEQ
ncbi:glycogenin-2 isoform X2 [Frieseomelitta varia]|uniref:glycogenin-2 isoform X2 n=1 Tax=Frieseomelitta varia TaxID=561572 RepID=UPI001CB6886B|nr:glycogenin-2 isoform X2 [Frieseomelitta varia]